MSDRNQMHQATHESPPALSTASLRRPSSTTPSPLVNRRRSSLAASASSPTRSAGDREKGAPRRRLQRENPPSWWPPCSAVTREGKEPWSTARTPLSTPDALRAFLEELTGSDARTTAAAEAVGTRSNHDTRGDGLGKPRLILRGSVAPGFLRVLLDAPLGIVDAGFVEAHVLRRRWRCMRERGDRGAQWNYPELVGGFARAIWGGAGEGEGDGDGDGERAVWPVVGDGLGKAVVRAVSDCEDLAAVECRASVWVGERVDVLFLDKPVWEDEGTLLTKGRRKRREGMAGLQRRVGKADTEKEEEAGWDASYAAAAEDEEFPSLEDALQQTMSTSAGAMGIDLVDVLEEAAYDKWLDFFEVLTPRQAPMVLDGTSLEWRALQALEGNLDMAKALSQRRRHESTDTRPDWSSLIQRLRDRTALLATIPPNPASLPVRLNEHPNARDQILHMTNFTGLPLPRRRRPRPRSPQRLVPDRSPAGDGSSSSSGSNSTENQRALDRVTYLGGILLPISIVSSVLSMNEDFEPGQRLFWVFWAAAVPLTLLTFVVIYADKLRSAEVWVEIGSLSGAGSTSGDQEAEEEEGAGKDKKKKKKKHDEEEPSEQEKWGNWAMDDRVRKERRPTARPQAVAYAGEDVVIDLSDAVAQSQPIALEPRTYNQPDNEHSDNEEDEEQGKADHRPSSASSFPPSSRGHRSHPSDDEEEATDDPNTYITRPIDGTRPHTWRKKQLGWGGAAMCILRMQKPLRVEDGLPVAAPVTGPVTGPRRDVERRRLRQAARQRASVEGRRSLSY